MNDQLIPDDAVFKLLKALDALRSKWTSEVNTFRSSYRHRTADHTPSNEDEIVRCFDEVASSHENAARDVYVLIAQLFVDSGHPADQFWRRDD